MSALSPPALFAKQLLKRSWLREAFVTSSNNLTVSVDLARQMDDSLRQAASNPNTNDFVLLVNLAAMCLRQRDPLPDWLADFSAGVLTGAIKKPRKRGEDVLKTERDYAFWQTSLAVAKRYKLPLYTNNELFEKTSSAEIVSQAAGCKVDIVVRAIKKFERKVRGKIPGDIFPQDIGG